MIFRLYFVLAIVLLLQISCGGGSTDPADSTPPSVNSVSPSDNALNITIDTTIVAVFSEPVDSGTVDSMTFSFSPEINGVYSFSSDSVIFTPSDSLQYSTEYTATLTTAITDTAGNGMAQDFSWSFTTASDPLLAPPVVVSTVPNPTSFNIEIDTNISATFSKAIDPSTITAASFTVSGGVTGTISYSDKTATFNPDSDLEYSTAYTVTLTTAITDTFGIAMEENYSWNFSTRADPAIPLVSIVSPMDSAIVGDDVTITVSATQPNGVEKVVLFINSNPVDSVLNQSGNIDFTWDASVWQIGSVHQVYARAFAEGNEATSQTHNLIYLWEEIQTDINDPWSTDIKRIYARTTTTLLELRCEFWENWSFPYPYDSTNDTTYFDPSFNVALFFDTDRNSLTGRSSIGLGQLNDLGVEYRLIIGLSGGDTALASPDVTCDTCWNKEYDTTGLARHVVPRDTNIFEIGILWDDLDNSNEVWFLMISADASDNPTDPELDWSPDKGLGHLVARRLNRFVGKPSQMSLNRYAPDHSKQSGISYPGPNPFR